LDSTEEALGSFACAAMVRPNLPPQNSCMLPVLRAFSFFQICGHKGADALGRQFRCRSSSKARPQLTGQCLRAQAAMLARSVAGRFCDHREITALRAISRSMSKPERVELARCGDGQELTR
jgi:hypothetical protein